MYNERLINAVLERLPELVGDRHFKGIEDHYAGYFDELGITINLTLETSAEQFEIIACRTLRYLNDAIPDRTGELKWTLSFYQSLQRVGLFFPGNDFADNAVSG